MPQGRSKNTASANRAAARAAAPRPRVSGKRIVRAGKPRTGDPLAEPRPQRTTASNPPATRQEAKPRQAAQAASLAVRTSTAAAGTRTPSAMHKVLASFVSGLQDNAVASFIGRRGFALLAGLAAALVALSALGVAGYRSTAQAELPRSTADAASASIAPADRADSNAVVVNGSPMVLAAGTSVAQVAEAAGISTEDGRLIAVDGSVIDEHGGQAFKAQVNGADAARDAVLAPGDVVELVAGADVEEESEETRTPLAASVWADDTLGSIHQVVSDGEASERVVKRGKLSGIETVVKEPESLDSAHLTKFSIRPKEKMIALTFDDGPWGQTTADLLDLLKEHGAHATFFVVGNCFDGDEDASALVKREVDEGHQVCTHTYTHAAAAKGFRMANLSSYEQTQEVERGQEAIAKATGKEASKVARMPGGAYDENVAFNLLPYVSYEIGWDIDTQDWRCPGADAIREALAKAEAGDVVLMHDGGGDRSQTVEALRTALPEMKADGWIFVTVDELLAAKNAARDAAAEAKPSVPLPEPESKEQQETETGSDATGAAGSALAYDAVGVGTDPFTYEYDYAYGTGYDYTSDYGNDYSNAYSAGGTDSLLYGSDDGSATQAGDYTDASGETWGYTG